jgi:hypothetical protein
MDQASVLLAFQNAGLELKHKVMSNGEHRYSVNLPDGSSFILTVAGDEGAWQDAHRHRGKGFLEVYTVIKGWIAGAFVPGASESSQPQLRRWVKGESFSFCNEPHNIYLPAGAIIHTTKVAGRPVGNPERKNTDWWPDYVLDKWSKAFSEEKLLLAADDYIQLN